MGTRGNTVAQYHYRRKFVGSVWVGRVNGVIFSYLKGSDGELWAWYELLFLLLILRIAKIHGMSCF